MRLCLAWVVASRLHGPREGKSDTLYRYRRKPSFRAGEINGSFGRESECRIGCSRRRCIRSRLQGGNVRKALSSRRNHPWSVLLPYIQLPSSCGSVQILGAESEEDMGFQELIVLGRPISTQMALVCAALDHCHVPGRTGEWHFPKGGWRLDWGCIMKP